jgi:hypothetical protein
MQIPENMLLHCGEGIMAHSGKIYVTTMAIAWKTGDDVSGSVVMVEVAQEPDSQGGYGLSATITVCGIVPPCRRDMRFDEKAHD